MSTALKCAQRVAIYARVSTASRTKHGDKVAYDQRPEVQEDLLRGVAERREWTVYRVYTDRISGGKESRPALDELMRDARRRQFEVVMVWRFDRFTRSTRHLVNALEEFRSLGIDFVSYEEAIDTASPLGKCMFSIVAAIAELERNLITERVRTGLAHAGKHGTKSGKPIGRPKRIFDRAQVAELRRKGQTWREIARQLGVGEGTVRRGGCQNPVESEI